MTETVEYKAVLDAPVDVAWQVVGDFGSLIHWVAGGDQGTIKLFGEGIGMERELTLPAIGAVCHRLEELDHEKRKMTYRLTGGRNIGMATYSVTIALEENGPERCGIQWEGRMTSADENDAKAVADRLRGAYIDMTERLNAYLRPHR